MVYLNVNDIECLEEIILEFNKKHIKYSFDYCNICQVSIVHNVNKKDMDFLCSQNKKIIYLVSDNNFSDYEYNVFYIMKIPINIDCLMDIVNKCICRNIDYTNEISAVLLDVGIAPSSLGYTYLKESINIVMNNEDNYIKDVYEWVASKYKTNESNVERNIRYSIESAFDKGRIDSINKILENSVDENKGKTSNAKFIKQICKYIKKSKNI